MEHLIMRNMLLISLALVILFTAVDARAQDCGRLENAYGPYDYSNGQHRREYLPIVEKFHFTRSVENLAKGRSDTVIGDLDYTLRAFPNHHRALYSMIRLQIGEPVPLGSQYYTAECYLQRAIRFKSTDHVPWLIYGIYLQRTNDLDNALLRYNEALRLEPEFAETNYNIGLLYIQLNDYDKALEYAHVAYSNGYQLPGLRNKLKRKGKWREPSPPPNN